MTTEENNYREELTTQDTDPLLIIKHRNDASVDQMNEVLSITLGHKFGRMMSAGFGVMVEYLLYAIAACIIAFIFIMERISPFFILDQMRENQAIQDALNPYIVESFTITVKVTIGLVALFIFTTAIALRRARRARGKMQDAIITLRDVRDDLKENSKELDVLNNASEKLLAAANVVANEADFKE